MPTTSGKTASPPRKRIAVFYYTVERANAIGRCNRIFLEHLCDEYDFTVFSSRFENPRPDRIQWVRIPCPLTPMVACYIIYRVLAFFVYLWRKLTGNWSYDLTMASDCCVGFTDGVYVQFCNQVYAQQWFRWGDMLSVRGFTRAANLLVQNMMEGYVLRRSKFVVVPSKGLWRELAGSYQLEDEKLVLISNPVDLARYVPDPAKRKAARAGLNLSDDRATLVFIALGHYERKGLGELIDALADSRTEGAALLVVGGAPEATLPYRQRAEKLGLKERITFYPTDPNPQRFLWAADAFVFPSRYETFSIVSFEAAASGLPVITTRLSGVEEFSRPGETGFVIREQSPQAVADSIHEFLALSREERVRMGENARAAVTGYGVAEFASAWEQLYARLLNQTPAGVTDGERVASS